MSPDLGSSLQQLGLTKSAILKLDPRLFSQADKKAYIELLYGDPKDWTWKRDLELVNVNRHRWHILLDDSHPKGEPYRISHKAIAQAAIRSRPASPGNDVTDFTDWIYRLYIPQKDYASLIVGQRAEREIARHRISIPKHSGWKLIHNGIGPEKDPALDILSLSVNGKPLRASPDLVFRERKANRVLIVEIKVTEATVPSNGWPNLRAQLWAYSQMQWDNASEILLVVEVWGFALGLRLREVLHWKRGDEQFQRENVELFNHYGGTVHNVT